MNQAGLLCMTLLAANAPASETQWLVGVVTEQHVRVCTGSQRVEWVDPHYEAGFVRLVVPKTTPLAKFQGEATLLTGRVDPSKRVPHPDHKGHCPGRQARSDWVFSKSGVRAQRNLPDGAARPEAFVVEQAASFEGIDVKHQGGNLVVSFTNALPVTLENVEIVVHYEGCYGKPLNPSQNHEFARVERAQTVSATFPVNYQWRPAHVKRPNPKRELHVADSIQIAAIDKRVLFDLDLPLDALGVKATCPERK